MPIATHVDRAWAPRLLVVAVLLVGAPACGGDEAVAHVPQGDYDREAARLCAQHGPSLASAYVDARPDSNAEEAAFYRTDLVPRVRALTARLRQTGLPAEREEAYRAAFADALAAAAELEGDPLGYLARRQQGRVPPDDDPVVRIRRALEAADVPC